MAEKLSVIILPDWISVSRETILRAALYFDEVYLDAFLPQINRGAQPDGSMSLKFSHFSVVDSELKDLAKAGVLQNVPQDAEHIITELSSRKLSLSVRKAVADSMIQGTSLLSASLLEIAATGVTGEIKVTAPYQFRITDPADLDDSRVELGICLHLASLSKMIGVCLGSDIRPLVDRPEHARLISQLAKEFPSVSNALGIEIPSFESKHSAVALKVLEDSLPDLRPRAAEDLLALRDEMKSELIAFRTEIAKLATTITSEIWEDGFEYEVEQLVARDVRPSIQLLKRRLGSPSKRMIKHLVSDWKSIATTTSVPLAAWLMNGASLPWAILGGASAGLGVAALKAKVEEWSMRSESAFTLILEAQKRL